MIRFELWRDSVAWYASNAYPRRHVKMLVLSDTQAFLAFERDEAIDGTRPFTVHVHRGHDWAAIIEKARVAMERAA